MTEKAGTREVHLAELYPTLMEILNQGGSFRITVTGMSMWPTLRHRRDQVTLTKPQGPLKKHDLPLYRRDNGQFILHRVVAVQDDGCYTCCGDHQWSKERNVRPDQIVAVAVGFCRKGREFDAHNRRYRLWVRFWDGVIPLRMLIFRSLNLLGRLRPKKKPETA